MTFYQFVKNVRHRNRLKEIVLAFYNQGFGFVIAKTKLRRKLSFTKRLRAYISDEEKVDLSVRLRLVFEQLGPTFVKFGQLLSLRPDLLPPEYVAEFEKMQDKVPPFSFEEAKKVVEEELGKPLLKLFDSFEKVPLASASIGQVHRAKFEGKDVAVKVQRPGIRTIIENDIEIMYFVAEMLDKYIPELAGYHIKGIVHEFEKWTVKELNYQIEAYYAQKVASNFKNSKILKIPKIYGKLSTKKVLTMEFIDGIPLHDVSRLKKKKINISKVLKNGYAVLLKQVFFDGLFHADPHPGNILILPDGKIGLIDFGIMGHFDKKLKNNSLALFRAILSNDVDKTAKVLLGMDLVKGREINEEQFKFELGEIFEEFNTNSIKDVQIGVIHEKCISLINKYHVNVPQDFVLYGKVVLTLEGLGLKYDPEFNFITESKSILGKLLDPKFFAKEILDKAKTRAFQYYDLLDTFPEYAAEILDKVRNFKLSIDVEDKDIKSLTFEMEKSSGNISLGLIVAALIIGSSLMIQTEVSAFYYVVGFIVAGILGLWLVKRTLFARF